MTRTLAPAWQTLPSSLHQAVRAAAMRGHGGAVTAEQMRRAMQWAAQTRRADTPIGRRELDGVLDGSRDLMPDGAGGVACVKRVDARARLVERPASADWMTL